MTEITKSGSGYILLYGKKEILFALETGQRKRLSISVNPDLSVTVSAPDGKPLEQILGLVRKRARWIKKQIDYFEQFRPLPTPRLYVSGETHRYLGRQYRLKIQQADSESVKLTGAYIVVELPDPSQSNRVKDLLAEWYRLHAKSLFQKKIEAVLAAAQSLDVGAPQFQLRKMKNRWGSCTKKGGISLNPELVQAPVYCIEYVILHELCHLKVHNHGKQFFQMLSRHMPDWRRRKERLDLYIPG